MIEGTANRLPGYDLGGRWVIDKGLFILTGAVDGQRYSGLFPGDFSQQDCYQVPAAKKLIIYGGRLIVQAGDQSQAVGIGYADSVLTLNSTAPGEFIYPYGTGTVPVFQHVMAPDPGAAGSVVESYRIENFFCHIEVPEDRVPAVYFKEAFVTTVHLICKEVDA